MITNSLEWNRLQDTLKRQARGLKHSRDVMKMIDNISSEITLLSRAEISARRGHRADADSLLLKINTDIEVVEEYILVAALLG